MKTYIERSHIDNLLSNHLSNTVGAEHYAYDVMKNDLENIPDADVIEIKHGYWIMEGPYVAMDKTYKKLLACSECDSVFVSDGNTKWDFHNYCPYCGTKMDMRAQRSGE